MDLKQTREKKPISLNILFSAVWSFPFNQVKSVLDIWGFVPFLKIKSMKLIGWNRVSLLNEKNLIRRLISSCVSLLYFGSQCIFYLKALEVNLWQTWQLRCWKWCWYMLCLDFDCYSVISARLNIFLQSLPFVWRYSYCLYCLRIQDVPMLWVSKGG
jgi:hypothetical protein